MIKKTIAALVLSATVSVVTPTHMRAEMCRENRKSLAQLEALGILGILGATDALVNGAYQQEFAADLLRAEEFAGSMLLMVGGTVAFIVDITDGDGPISLLAKKIGKKIKRVYRKAYHHRGKILAGVSATTVAALVYGAYKKGLITLDSSKAGQLVGAYRERLGVDYFLGKGRQLQERIADSIYGASDHAAIEGQKAHRTLWDAVSNVGGALNRRIVRPVVDGCGKVNDFIFPIDANVVENAATEQLGK